MKDITHRLREMSVGNYNALVWDEAADEIEKLRIELNKVRRELSAIMAGKGGKSSFASPDAIEYAKSKGWDCWDTWEKGQEAMNRLSQLDEENGL